MILMQSLFKNLNWNGFVVDLGLSYRHLQSWSEIHLRYHEYSIYIFRLITQVLCISILVYSQSNSIQLNNGEMFLDFPQVFVCVVFSYTFDVEEGWKVKGHILQHQWIFTLCMHEASLNKEYIWKEDTLLHLYLFTLQFWMIQLCLTDDHPCGS